jgi:formamidase
MMQHFKIKPGLPLAEQPELGHNRWHPDIPFLSKVMPGEEIIIETLDFLDAQIRDDDSIDDVRDVDLTRAHPLTGPFYVEGAEPGDLLVIDLLDIKPITPVGFSGVFAKSNGGGFLDGHFPDAAKAIWDLKGLYATSRHIPGVRIAGLTHPGLMGTLPTPELLAEWNRREAPLAEKGLAKPPEPSTAVLRGVSGAEFDRMAREAARTVPPREHGGNTDIKDLSSGSRIFFPVYVKGAGFSMGDLHFSQGDGEISFCGAIEMNGASRVGFDLIKGGMAKYNLSAPVFMPSPVKPHYDRWLTFEGISVENGTNYYLDATVAYRQACLKAIDYLANFGFTGPQAYMLLTAAPIEGRIGGIVDVPNCSATVSLPVDIFEQDIVPAGMLNDRPYWGHRG